MIQCYSTGRCWWIFVYRFSLGSSLQIQFLVRFLWDVRTLFLFTSDHLSIGVDFFHFDENLPVFVKHIYLIWSFDWGELEGDKGCVFEFFKGNCGSMIDSFVYILVVISHFLSAVLIINNKTLSNMPWFNDNFFHDSTFYNWVIGCIIYGVGFSYGGMLHWFRHFWLFQNWEMEESSLCYRGRFVLAY